MGIDLVDYERKAREATMAFWGNREKARQKQIEAGKADQGERAGVTAGKNMDGFIALVIDLIEANGLAHAEIHQQRAVLTLPGYFRPTKLWDLLVINEGRLVAAVELKSQVGPSFGNNFNNRTEEAMGSALDLWTAFRENAFGSTARPWIGYMFLLEDCPRSNTPVGVKEPHFKVFPEFRDSSYAKRYEIFCRRLVRERHYDCAAFLMSNPEKGLNGDFSEPAADLTFHTFANSLVGCVETFLRSMKKP